MKIARLLFVCLLFSSFISSAQQKRNCDSILSRKIDINAEPRVMLDDMKCLQGCGLDSIDMQICINGPTLGPLLMMLMHDKDQMPTYRDILLTLDTVLKSDEYRVMKQNIAQINTILNKPASLQNWNSDTKAFLDMGYTVDELNDAKAMLADTRYEHLTYRELFYEYKSVLKGKQEVQEANAAESTAKHISLLKAEYAPYCDTSLLHRTNFNIVAFASYEEGIKCAKNMGRHVLVFFNGINCVNCRKMEQGVLINCEIAKVLADQFVVIDLYCDDRTSVEAKFRKFSKALNAQIETVGDKNAALEIEKYGANSQPFFVFLDKNGTKVATSSYTTDLGEFLSFLAMGLKK